jgi:hypothetical protein
VIFLFRFYHQNPMPEELSSDKQAPRKVICSYR